MEHGKCLVNFMAFNHTAWSTLQCSWSRVLCGTTMANIRWKVNESMIFVHSNTKGWVLMHGGISVCLFSCNLCNTFTVRHRTNRLVTQRHVVKTDVWHQVDFSSAVSSLHQFSALRCDESDSKLRFVPGLTFLWRLTLVIMADCLHRVGWGGTGVLVNQLHTGVTFFFFFYEPSIINHRGRKYKL